jgi:hypothetical protein
MDVNWFPSLDLWKTSVPAPLPEWYELTIRVFIAGSGKSILWFVIPQLFLANIAYVSQFLDHSDHRSHV